MKKDLSKLMRKSIALLMATTIVLGGCSKKEGNNTAGKDGGKTAATEARYELDPETPAWKLDPQETTELTWYINADWWNTDWGNDIITKKIEEDLHLKIKFIVGDDTTLNTLFASGEMPDLISVFDASSQVALKADSWAQPLYEVADKYDPYFRKVASEETLNWLQLDDGKSYGYANYSNTATDYESGLINSKTAFVIRKDIYEALGSPSMGTQEEFLNVLGQIKTQYPELYSFGFNAFTTESTGSMGDPFQDFIGVPLLDDSGNFYYRNLDEDYLSWIETFSEAHRLGYISDDSFADDGTAFEEKLKSGKYATIMLDGTPQSSGFLTTWMNSNPDSAYIAIDGPQSTVGNQPTLNQAGISGWTVTYITKQCKDPAKAIQLYTYLLSEEGQILTTFGIEGETYTINDEGKYELTQEAKDMQQNENDRFKKEYRIGEFFIFGHDKYKAYGEEPFPESIKQLNEWGEGKLAPHFVLENTSPDAGTEAARTNSAVTTEWTTTLVSLIRSDSDEAFNSVLESYKSFLDDNDWSSVVEIKNQKIERNKQKLGY